MRDVAALERKTETAARTRRNGDEPGIGREAGRRRDFSDRPI